MNDRSCHSQTEKGPSNVLEKFWKSHLLKLPAATNCITVLTNLSIEANSVDTDQTAPTGHLLNVYKIVAK